MQLIQNNPYRTVGILAGATAAEQRRQLTRLQRFLEADQEPEDDFSFPVIGEIVRTVEIVTEAASKLNLDSDKINAALFWFWNGNSITDEVAFDALKEGNIEKAISIWSKLTSATEVSQRNASAFSNLSTLYLNQNTNESILEQGISLKLKFLESDFIKDFKALATDETYKTTKKDLQLVFLNQIQTEIEKGGGITSTKFLEILIKQTFSAKQDFLKGFVQKPIEKIEKQIEETRKKQKANPAKALEHGNELYRTTKQLLDSIISIIGKADIKTISISDKLANEILQCAIGYFDHSQENENDIDYFEPTLSLAKKADLIAISSLTKDRIKDTFVSLEEMKDKEILSTIEVLKSVKESFEENKKEIQNQIRHIEETDFEIRLGRKSINRKAVEDNIKNSINWQRVNELIILTLTDKNLNKIKESDKIEVKKEFWELLNWVKENSLKPSEILVIIDKYKNIPPKLCFEVLSAEVTNTNNKPFYVEDIRFIGMKLKVKSFGNQKITIFGRYINPERILENNPKISPKGYTKSQIFIITSETKEIILTGWGNETECTHQVGEHRIELYVEDYKIYSTTFQVNWSPKKKVELIKNLELLQSELREVEKFIWFRLPENKQNQVEQVLNKIKKAKQILMNK